MTMLVGLTVTYRQTRSGGGLSGPMTRASADAVLFESLVSGDVVLTRTVFTATPVAIALVTTVIVADPRAGRVPRRQPVGSQVPRVVRTEMSSRRGSSTVSSLNAATSSAGVDERFRTRMTHVILPSTDTVVGLAVLVTAMSTVGRGGVGGIGVGGVGRGGVGGVGGVGSVGGVGGVVGAVLVMVQTGTVSCGVVSTTPVQPSVVVVNPPTGGSVTL